MRLIHAATGALLVMIPACGGAQPKTEAAPAVSIATGRPEATPTPDPWALPVDDDRFVVRLDLAAIRAAGFQPSEWEWAGLSADSTDLRGCAFDLFKDTNRATLSGNLDSKDRDPLLVAQLHPDAGAIDCQSDEPGSVWRRKGRLILFGRDARVAEAEAALAQAPTTASDSPRHALLEVRGRVEALDGGMVELRVAGGRERVTVTMEADVPPDVDLGEAIEGGRQALERIATPLGKQDATKPWKAAVLAAGIDRDGRRLSVSVPLALTDELRTFISDGRLARLYDNGKIAQCNRLIEVINREQGPLKEASGSDPAALRDLASVLRGVAQKVTAVDLEDPQLASFRDHYAEMAFDLAQASDDTATALEGNDPSKAIAAAKAMSSFGSRESDLVDEINRYCSGEP